MADKYLIQLTTKQFIAGVTTAISVLSGGGFIAVKTMFDSAVQKEVKIQYADKKLEYEKKIDELSDELKRLKESTTMSEQKVASVIDDKNFLLIHSQYLISYANYVEKPTKENLQYMTHIQNEYVKYLKYKKLNVETPKDPSSFQFFSGKARIVDGVVYEVPQDILMKVN